MNWRILSVFAVAVSVLMVTSARLPEISGDESESARVASSIEHGPIYIVGDDGFTTENGVVAGSGIEGDPYQIKGWNISTSSGNCIEIVNTTSNFVIQHSTIGSGQADPDIYVGIRLHNVTNGRIENVSISSKRYGVHIDLAAGCQVWGSNSSFNDWSGISVIESEDIQVLENALVGNGEGIFLENVTSAAVSGNTCHGFATSHEFGVYLTNSEECSISENTISGCWNTGIILSNCSQARVFHNNLIDNWKQAIVADGIDNLLDNGYPSGGNYWSDCPLTDDYCGPEQDFPGPDGIVDVAYAAGTPPDRYPLTLPFHSVICIDGNGQFTPENGVESGIGTEEDPYIIAGWSIDASLAGGGAGGIAITNVDTHFVIRDMCIRAGGMLYCGIWLSNVWNGAIEECLLVDNYEGVTVNSTVDTTIRESRILRSVFAGIYVIASEQIRMSSNEVSGTGHGLMLHQSSGIVVSDCNISYCEYGVYMLECTDSEIKTNLLTNNTCALYQCDCEDILIEGNTFFDNGLDVQETGAPDDDDDDTPDGAKSSWILLSIGAIAVAAVALMVLLVVRGRGRAKNL